MKSTLKIFVAVCLRSMLFLFVASNVSCNDADISSGSGCSAKPPEQDNGRLIRHEKELRPLYMPFRVVISREILDDNTGAEYNKRRIKLSVLYDAVQWWHATTGRSDLFRIEIIDSYRTNVYGDPSPPHGQVYMRIEDATHVGSEDISDRGGITTLAYHTASGMIYCAVISINIIMLESKLHQRNVFIHELGHVLGLDDDANATRSKSIMRSKLILDRNVLLTEKDRRLILEL